MRAPVGILEIQALYGNPFPLMRDDGTPSPIWENRMVKVDLPGPLRLGWSPDVLVKTARVNQVIAAELDRVLRALKGCGAWENILTYDGGYTWRPQRGSNKLSMHAYGGAVDFNAAGNGLGMKPTMPQLVVEVFENHGWDWGGRWKRPDGMHFQWGKGA